MNNPIPDKCECEPHFEMPNTPNYNYQLTINEVDTNTKFRVRYTQKGAGLWDWLAGRGYVCLIPYAGFGYFYKFAELKRGLEKAYEEGLTKHGGHFYEEKYYA